MRWSAPAAVILAAVASSGCLVLSLQPAYDAASVVYEEQLLGRWENAEDQTSAVIERAEWKAYKVAFTDRFATRTFHGNLARVGTSLFLDLTEFRGADHGPYLIPVHGLFRIAVTGDTLSASPLDYNWFTRAAAQKSAPGLALAIDDRRNVVVSASTSAWQRWLKSPPAAAFSAPTIYKRKP